MATAGSTSTPFREGRFLRATQSRSDGDRLFRNRGDGTFEDVTERAGIASFPRGYGHGVTVGDYDNDGRPDLFVTRWHSYALYRNQGDGRFEDVTVQVRLGRRSRLADLGGLRRPRRRRRPGSLRLPLSCLRSRQSQSSAMHPDIAGQARVHAARFSIASRSCFSQ